MAGVDPATKDGWMGDLYRLSGKTLIVSSHAGDIAWKYDNVALTRSGLIIAQGPIRELIGRTAPIPNIVTLISDTKAS